MSRCLYSVNGYTCTASFTVQLVVIGSAKSFGVLFVEFREKFGCSADAAAWITALNGFMALCFGLYNNICIHSAYYLAIPSESASMLISRVCKFVCLCVCVCVCGHLLLWVLSWSQFLSDRHEIFTECLHRRGDGWHCFWGH